MYQDFKSLRRKQLAAFLLQKLVIQFKKQIMFVLSKKASRRR